MGGQPRPQGPAHKERPSRVGDLPSSQDMAREAVSRYGLLPVRQHVPLAHRRPEEPTGQDGPAEGDEPPNQGVPRQPQHIRRRGGILCQKRDREKRVCAVDSTGFSIRRYVRWFDIRHGKRRKRRDFLKLHFIVDCTSLLILSFKVTPPFKSDGKQVEYLLSFINELGRLCADKAYLSRKICDLVAKHGGEPYISIKKNVVRIRSQGSKAWRQMLVLHRRSRRLYLKKYHRRSLAETAVSARLLLWYFFRYSRLLLLWRTSICLQALLPWLLILTTFFLIEMYGSPPCFATRSHIFLERYALSAQSLPSSLMNERRYSTCFPSDLKGGVTLKESMSRLVQSTMKCSLRKSLLFLLLPCLMSNHLT